MFKVFDTPRPLHIFDIREQYQNKAFILINTKVDTEYQGTVTGELYAISDDTQEDRVKYAKEIRKLQDLHINAYVGDTFNDEGMIE